MSVATTDSATLRDAAVYAHRGGSVAGSLLVAAAGNQGDTRTVYPAGYPEVVSVAATDASDRRVLFSNANADVEVAAPGDAILSTLPGGYGLRSGTSMAAPAVAGAASLLRGLVPELTVSGVRELLSACAHDLAAPGRDNEFGFGRIDLARTVAAATGIAPCAS
jgi:thermitase